MLKSLRKLKPEDPKKFVSPKNFGGRLHRRRWRKSIFVVRLRRLRLVKADMRSQESRRRMEKAEKSYRHLRDETTDELRLRVEKFRRGFAMLGLQTV
ncbi:hypothetical protein AXG93_4773s1210 [Marchantia polymorpha subsp. ruderalis]|uniref:Uncharacterized protein n=1 Tax=Marchantia polymorpha subsp. ruderalis TaxID=1480154 RepID=A0A176WIW1_MARPO|nr:hypothetical protein AXG93_4773s1210 [Marchantia polymorpha subsp. ruderalis]